MAGAPRWKVYNHSKHYVAACKLVEDAALIVGSYGHGATIRDGHLARSTVWREGIDGEAGESVDYVVEIVHGRCGIE